MKIELISKTQYAVLTELKIAAGENRKPTVSELSFKLSVCVDTVYSAIQHLIKKGYIVRETRYKILRFPDEVRDIKNLPRKGAGLVKYNKCSLEAVFHEDRKDGAD